jgi:Fic family protein
MLRISFEGREFTMMPGEWRSIPEHDVAVGRHQPPSSARVDAFMRYFAERYRFELMGRAGRIIAMAAAHHRFNYIHPFPDGNGRVSRLMSHAMAWRAGIAAHGLWSISREPSPARPSSPGGTGARTRPLKLTPSVPPGSPG